MMTSVDLSLVIEKMELKNLTPEVDISNKKIIHPDINRPALQLAGFFEYYDCERVQIIGFIEYTYMEKLSRERRFSRYEKLLEAGDLPCVVFCRGFLPDEDFLKLARKNNIPLLSTDKVTSPFIAEITSFLYKELAPSITIHGVLVDVYGEGILITGESGIGKSEAALELIRRGHRLVADDVVEIRRVSNELLVGKAPDITRHFIEVRGIGIIDVKALFGVGSVKEDQQIDAVIQFEDWDRAKEYDRLGMKDEYIEYLGNKVINHKIPIRPGRNLAIIVESAAMNGRQKKMGYNAAHELYKRVQSNFDN